MRTPRLILLALFAVTALLPARAQTAVLIGEYALQGTLDDNLSGPALVAAGGAISALGYTFTANQGLTLTTSALNVNDFSIELSFRFDLTDGYRKILDFHNLASDDGFYVYNSYLNFYPVTGSLPVDFSPGTDVDVVLTRDGATGTLTGYVNGQQRFSFTDSSNFAVFTATDHHATFFIDDVATGQREASGGTLNYMRVFNGALTASEVNTLFLNGAPAVPEPSTAILMALGGATLLGAGWHRRKNQRRA